MGSARVHVLYLEQADDQRGADGARCVGVHLGEPGRGACLCASCGGVADVWRGRLDNMQTTLRMCCAEGAIFRPFVEQFAFASPRHSLLYDLPRLGGWMRAQGAKRPTEALIVGSALRAHAGELAAEESGITVTRHASAAGAALDEAMWEWTAQFVRDIRARARADGGVALALSLDKKAPLLSPSPMAGVLGRAMGGAQPPIRDIIVAIGGPSGLTHGWGARLGLALAEPRVAVSLRGGLQHSYGALVDVLLMHERAELVPALADRLSVPPELLKRARAAEHELRRAWLARLGLHDESARQPPSEPARPGGAARIEAALGRHAACIAALAPAAGAHLARAAPADHDRAAAADRDGARAPTRDESGVALPSASASRAKHAKRVAKRRRVPAGAQ